MKTVAVSLDENLLNYLAATVKKVNENADILTYTNPIEAINYVKNSPCDVAFIETEINGVSGIDIAISFIEYNSKINIIFISDKIEYAKEAFEIHASGYVMKPLTEERLRKELSELRIPTAKKTRLKVLTFGNFQVLYNGKPVVFKYQKTKELFAYLIDRKGAMCTAGEIMTIIFEDDLSHKAYYHRLRADLINTLKSLGCESAITKQHGMLGVIKDEVDCDYFDYLEGREELSKNYHGEYMAQYSFAEITGADLFSSSKS